MTKTFPGLTVEVSVLNKGCSLSLFDGIFAAGGITLSQVSIMTGLEPYQIQNWVKRGFVSSPQRRLYSRAQFARIAIINMLRESLQLEKICSLIRLIDETSQSDGEASIRDEELYHRYVDMLSENAINLSDPQSIINAATKASLDSGLVSLSAQRRMVTVLQIMFCAHAASDLRLSAETLLGSLE